jgi:threonine/homoserine/homoserine lactone efflux protein
MILLLNLLNTKVELFVSTTLTRFLKSTLEEELPLVLVAAGACSCCWLLLCCLVTITCRLLFRKVVGKVMIEMMKKSNGDVVGNHTKKQKPHT